MSHREPPASLGSATADFRGEVAAYLVAGWRRGPSPPAVVADASNPLDAMELAHGVDVTVLCDEALETYFPDRAAVRAA